MTVWEAVFLLVGGAVAGTINAMAGGGSTLTVPLLVLAGVPGIAANGSNRVGILTSNIASHLSFRRSGLKVDVRSLPAVLAPAIVGAAVGAFGISRVTDEAFERGFGLLMIPLVLLSLRPPRVAEAERSWSTAVVVSVFFLIGVYAGAVQAGVGLLLVAALHRTGFDLVTANAVKVLFIIAATLMALPIFIAQGNVDWGPAIVLAVGLSAGGWVGAHVAVQGGERIVRIVMVVAAIVLAGRLLGLYG